jgi:glutathione S-transferase
MASTIKPLTFWGGPLGPNPGKVYMILKELGVPFETIATPLSEVKSPAYTKINPNGRLPALHDPNTDLTIWESGAIIEYLIEKYDSENKLSFPHGTKEYWLSKQWLYFQMSGQGPYYGQAWYVFPLI